jgi:hypothetical protein
MHITINKLVLNFISKVLQISNIIKCDINRFAKIDGLCSIKS